MKDATIWDKWAKSGAQLMMDYVKQERSKPPFKELPRDILNIIEGYITFPMSLEAAKKYREELMTERKFFTKRNTETVLFERPFSLCEH